MCRYPGTHVSARPLPGPVNLGNPEEFTLRELADLAIRKTGSGSTIANRALPMDDPTRRCPGIGMARAAPGWQRKVALDEGLSSAIDYFRTEPWLSPAELEPG